MKEPRVLRHFPIAVLLATALLLGILVVPHYGESWDEADIRRYSAYAVDAPRYFLRPAELPKFETNLNLYGPGYFAGAGILAQFVHSLARSWSLVTAWHAVYFVTFLGGILLLYMLALRFMSPSAAFGACLLFITQPLFWGHAFINPKDIPFLTFFVASIHFGLRMVDDLMKTGRARVSLLIAAVLLGFTSSLRVLGPLAGMIVLAWAGWKAKSRAVLPAILYVLIAGLAAYSFWPYLWPAPLSHLVESLHTMADFPFNSTVLWRSDLYKANQLPMAYVPTLLAIQLTEPALLLIPMGIVFSLMKFLRGTDRAPFLLFLVWFLVPTAAIAGARMPLYDNARQLYFLVPPLFLVSGLALDRLFGFIKPRPLRAAVFLAAALPGVLIGIRLHPYEYVYYNSLVKGTGGAFRAFEMDYWGTSFEEIGAYANANLPVGSSLLVYGPEQIIAARARPDLHVYIPREQFNPGYDYVILLTRSNADQRLCKEANVIRSVERRGAVFAELRSIPAGARCQ